MPTSNESAQGSRNTDTISFKLKLMPKAGAYQLREVNPEEISPEQAEKLLTSDNLSPRQLMEGLVNRDKATLINRNDVYAPGVDWYERAKTKKQHIPAAAILGWMEEGNNLKWERSKLWGKKLQMQTIDALKVKTKAENTELGLDDLLF